jgi:hypothetical protein
VSSDTRPTPALGLAAVTGEGNGNGHHDEPREPVPRIDHDEERRRADESIPRGLSPEEYARLAAVTSYRAGSASAACYGAVGEMLVEIKMLASKNAELTAAHVALTTRIDPLLRWVERQILQEAQVIPPQRPKLPSLREEDLGEPIEKTSNGTPVYKTSQPQLRAFRETAYSDALEQAAIGEQQRTRAAIEEAFRAYHAETARTAEIESLRTKAAPIVYLLDTMPKIGTAALLCLTTGLVGYWLHAFLTHH